MNRKNTFLLLVCLLISGTINVSAREAYIPPALSEWTEWAMHGNETWRCPSAYNNHESKECIWPGELQIEADEKGATFTQTWNIISEGFVSIPGNSEIWPQNVTANGSPAPVTLQEENPAVYLKPGEYKISGSFKWETIPARIKIPDITGIIKLKINENRHMSPLVDETGYLWLARQAEKNETGTSENRMDVKVLRLIDDDSPMKVTTLVQLSISGEVRRESLEPETLLPESKACAMSSPLQLKTDEKGIVRFEAKPGRWDIRIESVIEKTPDRPLKGSCPYGPEIWTFRLHPELRSVKIEGAGQIDPKQTTLPEEWHQYNSYLVKKDEMLTLREIKRGSVNTSEGDLSLFRDLWLDFDGKGAVVKDQIKGSLERRFFLGLEKNDYLLGRVTSGGEDQLITSLDRNLGVEMEKGAVELSAVSRMEKISAAKLVPVGWNTKFQKASGNIHIPPGWRLVALNGGSVPDYATWIDRWSLLDFFVLMLISIATGRIWGIKWGILFFAGLVLIAHEPFAPKSLWIFVTVTAAFSAFIEKSEITRTKAVMISKIAHIAACLVLVLSGIVFCYTQIRLAIYPQLEKPWMVSGGMDQGIFTKHNYAEDTGMSMPETAPAPVPATVSRMKKEAPSEAGLMAMGSQDKRRDYSVGPHEKAITQTGPGLPEWKWTTVPVQYGLAGGSHSFSLWLASPSVNKAAGFVRVFLFLMLAARFININISNIFRQGIKISQIAVLACLSILIPFSVSYGSEIPGQELLKEMEKRLTEAASCFPECASVSMLKIIVAPDSKQLEIIIKTDAIIKTAIPLPESSDTWKISSVSMNSFKGINVLKREGSHWILLPEGSHTISVKADLQNRSNIKFTFPIKPMFVEIDAEGWSTAGLDENRQVPAELIMSKISGHPADEGAEEFSETASGLEGFLKVTRTVSLGIEWKAVTRVERLFETGGPQSVSAEIPLIKGEIVHSEKLRPKNGMVRVDINPGELFAEWSSSIPVNPEIRMHVPENATWGEIWHINASSIWHVLSEGAPEVHAENQPGTFWYPRPGETLVIKAKKLVPAEGDSTTIDSVNVNYHTGDEYCRILVNAGIRSSQGGILPVKTPDGATLKNIKINGIIIPVAETSGKINVPLQPGNQKVDIEWIGKPDTSGVIKKIITPEILRLPAIDMGKSSSNINISMHLPEKIWLLFTFGPRLGPAVLFWGYLIVVMAGAILLGIYAPLPMKTADWLLLGMGLAPLGAGSIVFTVVWFTAIHFRSIRQPSSKIFFRLAQLTLIAATFFMVQILYSAIKQGLLGIPDMQISGNGSTERILKWTLDRSGEILPRPWVALVSVYFFRLFMFAWAVWLAFRVTDWAKWTVSAFKSGGIWQKS